MKKIKIFLVFFFLTLFFFANNAEEKLTRVENREMQIPTNLNIQVSSSTLTISWDTVNGAMAYKVYASDNPENNYIDVSNLGTFDETSWTTTLSEETKKFYYVTSILKNALDISVEAGVVLLNWDAVPGASSYKIYSSDEINGVFSDVSDSGTFNGSAWVKDISAYELKFYYFTAIINGSESETSETVGFKKFNCQTTNDTNLNFIATSFSQNGMLASEFATKIGDCDAISKWNPEKQCWESANNAGYKWLNDFQIQNGYAYMINIVENKNIYVAGKIIQQPNYNLITTAGTNLNSIMIPLDRNDISTASQLGSDIDNCEQVTKFNASSQGWVSADPSPFGWVGDFPVNVGMPLFISVVSDTTWPNQSKNSNK